MVDCPITQLEPGQGKAEGWRKWNTVGKSGMGKKYTEETRRGRFTVVLKRCGNKNKGGGDFSAAF